MVEGFSAKFNDLPIRENHFESEDMVGCNSVLETMNPAGIFGDIPANCADKLARGVGGIVISAPAHRIRDPEVYHARLCDHTLILNINFYYAVHTRERD